jgi:ribosomal protein S18 acetylase RimI-like enzyme
MQKDVLIKKMSLKDIDFIANLTFKLPYFAKFVSLLGLQYLRTIYIRNIVESKASFGFIALSNNEPIGFLIVGHPVQVYYKDITSKRNWATFPYLFFAFLKHPIQILSILKVKFFLSEYIDDIRSEIVLLAIEPRYLDHKNSNGKKVSHLLMEATLEACEVKDIKSIKTETPAENEAAKGFYKKYGFEEDGKISFNKELRTILKKYF